MTKLDWNYLWTEAIGRASWAKHPTQISRKKAEQYNSDSKLRDRWNHQVGWITSKLTIDSNTTILDIGAGTGALAIPLSKMVKHVTAVEPSDEMLSCLKVNMLEEKIANIDVINKRWEDVIPYEDFDKHDVLIASYSLSMPDIKAALLKMDMLAKKYIWLFTFVGNPQWDYGRLWPALYGEQYYVGPDYIYIYNVLYDMRIYANINIVDFDYVQCFSSLDAAIEFWKSNLNVTTEQDEAIIRSYLVERLINENGLYWSKYHMKSAMIWWEKEI
jgi:SAM-dependent methyltransferase